MMKFLRLVMIGGGIPVKIYLGKRMLIRLNALLTILTAIFILSIVPQHATAKNLPDQFRMERTDGVFKGQIGEYWVLNGIQNDTIRRIELGVHWTGLLGQPVESYTFLWEGTGSFPTSTGGRLARSSVSEYPDLLKRYDDIKPLKINMRMDIFALRPRNDEGQDPNFFMKSFAAKGTKQVRSTPHLQIQTSGLRSSNFIPSSPPSYRDFIDWDQMSSVSDKDAAAQNTMRATKTIKISNLRIESIEWPMASIDFLSEALALKLKDGEQEDNIVDESESNNSETERGNIDDNFWSVKKDSPPPKINTRPSVESNFWTEDNVISNSSDTLRPSEIRAGGFWSTESIETERESLEIKKQKVIKSCNSRSGWFWDFENASCQKQKLKSYDVPITIIRRKSD